MLRGNKDDVDKLERTGVETIFVIEVENQNQEIDLYYSADGTLIKSIETLMMITPVIFPFN